MAIADAAGEKRGLADTFREAMRRTASGVSVLTTDGPAGKAGVTISTLCSLSMEPPSIIACVHSRSTALAAILANGTFSGNVLAEGQAEIALVFSGQRPGPQAERFGGAKWKTSALGNPYPDDALACFDCQLAAQFEFGSHKIIVGEVKSVIVSDRKPLIYSRQIFSRLEGDWSGISGFM